MSFSYHRYMYFFPFHSFIRFDKSMNSSNQSSIEFSWFISIVISTASTSLFLILSFFRLIGNSNRIIFHIYIYIIQRSIIVSICVIFLIRFVSSMIYRCVELCQFFFFSSSFELFRVNHPHNHCDDRHPQSRSYYWIDFDIFFRYIVVDKFISYSKRIFPIETFAFLSKLFAGEMCFLLENNTTQTSTCVLEWMNARKDRDIFRQSYICFIPGFHLISHDLFINERMNGLLYFISFHEWQSVQFSCISLKDQFVICIKSLHFIVIHPHSHMLFITN